VFEVFAAFGTANAHAAVLSLVICHGQFSSRDVLSDPAMLPLITAGLRFYLRTCGPAPSLD
jgi:hypothetical protein